MFSSKIVVFDCESLSTSRLLLKRKNRFSVVFLLQVEGGYWFFLVAHFLKRNYFTSVFSIVDPLEQNKNKDSILLAFQVKLLKIVLFLFLNRP